MVAVMEVARAGTSAPSVAFQGAPGAFSEEAVLACFGPGARTVPCRAFEDVTRAVERGDVAFGMLPVENSLAGTVTAAYDALAASRLQAVAEVVLPIRHLLLGVPGSDLRTVRCVLSHPVALAQCKRFLERNPHLRAVAAYDTAGAAEEISRGNDPTRAAIAGRSAAERYGLGILEADVQDRADNATRFLGVKRADETNSRGAIAPAGKTILIATTENRPGALLELLTPFASRGINLTKLESRPGELPWTYRFIIELEHCGDVSDAVGEVSERAASLRVLGSFRRDVAAVLGT
jgi:prephenate dehydratase